MDWEFFIWGMIVLFVVGSVSFAAYIWKQTFKQ